MALKAKHGQTFLSVQITDCSLTCMALLEAVAKLRFLFCMCNRKWTYETQ